MRTIEEIKADINKTSEYKPHCQADSNWKCGRIIELQDELLNVITSGIPLDRLEAICQAEREQRCMVIPKPLTVSDVEMMERVGCIVKNLTDMEKFMAESEPEAAQAALEEGTQTK